MLTIFAIVLGLIIILSAVGADRSARAHHRLRAIIWNLCGIACLLFGLLTIYVWSRGHVGLTRRVAVATPAGAKTTVVRLLVDADGRLEYPGQRADHSRAVASQTSTASVGVKAEADNPRDPVAPKALGSPNALAAEALELDEMDALGGTKPDTELAPEQWSQVQIDFDARPAWVDQPEVDKGQVHQISVSGGPFRSLREARKELYEQLRIATDEYIDEVVGNSHASQWVHYSPDEIRRTLVSSDHFFDEQVKSPSFGDMYQSHALLEFGPDFYGRVEQDWHQVMARTQLVRVALLGGAILGVLVLLFGYFHADTATRGFYSGRLKFLTAVTILGLIAAGLLFARSIPWLWL